jgi:predicted peptidase
MYGADKCLMGSYIHFKFYDMPFRSHLLAVIFCAALFNALASGVFAQANLFASASYKSKAGDSLRYRLLVPDANASRKLPLVIFLHGSGERGTDNEAQLKWGVLNFASDYNMKMHPAFVLAPQCPPNQGWANIDREDQMTMKPEPSRPMALLAELIQETIKKLPVDTNRIYITGLSMGGYGTFDIVARYPNLFAAALPVCGAGDVRTAAAMARVPMWIITGAEDPAVSPAQTHNMFKALTDAGARPGYTQYPEVGHFSWIHAYSDPLVLEWLFRQRK